MVLSKTSSLWFYENKLQNTVLKHICTFQGTKASKPPKPAASDLPVPAEGVRNIKSMWERGNVFSSPSASGTPNKVWAYISSSQVLKSGFSPFALGTAFIHNKCNEECTTCTLICQKKGGGKIKQAHRDCIHGLASVLSGGHGPLNEVLAFNYQSLGLGWDEETWIKTDISFFKDLFLLYVYSCFAYMLYVCIYICVCQVSAEIRRDHRIL